MKIITLFLLMSLNLFSMELKEIVKYYNSKIKEEEVLQLEKTVHKYEKIYGINRYVVYSIIATESNFRNIFGDSGKSIGYGQIQLPTAEFMKKKFQLDEELSKKRLIEDVDLQVKYTVLYIKYLYELHDQDIKATLLSYNAGPLNFKKNRFNSKYFEKVSRNYTHILNRSIAKNPKILNSNILITKDQP